MIIWLASYPRSGNTFLRILIQQVYGARTHELYEGHRDVADADAMVAILGGPPPDLSLDEMRRAEDIYLVKTHDLPNERDPAIYLVRDGRDALVSHAHFILQYDERLPPDLQRARFDDTLNMLIETDVSFGGWSGNVRAWTTRSTATAVIRFEDLIESPLACLRQAMAAVGCRQPELPAPWIPTFEELHQKLPQFFRKGRVGCWREEMREDLQELFWNRHGDVMRIMGYTRS